LVPMVGANDMMRRGGYDGTAMREAMMGTITEKGLCQGGVRVAMMWGDAGL
jgi:hypothetical protein